jgi:uncharacterized membrane protein YtjA (UPF0391 family)
MLRLALLFLVLALIAALFGWVYVADQFVTIAQILFVVFLVLALISFIAGAFRGAPPPA